MKRQGMLFFIVLVMLVVLTGCMGARQDKLVEGPTEEPGNEHGAKPGENVGIDGEVNTGDVYIGIEPETGPSGDGTSPEFFFPFDPNFYSIPTWIGNIVGRDRYIAWIEQFASHSRPAGAEPLTIITAVVELGIAEEDFKKHNVYCFSPEQVEAIYSGSASMINRAFASPYALLVDDFVFPPDWLASRTTWDYEKAGIRPEHLAEYLSRIDMPEFRHYYLPIRGNYARMMHAASLQLRPSRREMQAPYSLAYYGLPGFLTELVGQESMTMWAEEFMLDLTTFRRKRSISECNIVSLVRDLGVARPEFERANDGQVYTDQQIDAIYSCDQAAVDEAFVSKYAVFANGQIYSAEWLALHHVGQYQQAGIPVEILNDYFKRIEAMEERDDVYRVLGKIK